MSATATIRVPIETRDRLALVARERGQSLSSYLSALSREEFRAMIIESARQEAIMDASNPTAVLEYGLWDQTVGDGVD